MPLKPEFRLFDTNGTRQPLPVQFLLAAGWELLEHGSYDTVSLPLTVELEDTAIPALLAPGWRLDIQLDGAYSATAVSRPEELRRGEVRARPAPQTQSRLAADQIGRRWDFAGFSPETDGPDEGHNSTVTPIRPVGPVPAAFFMKSSLMRVVFRILIAPVLALPAFAALMSDAAEQKSPPAPAPRPAEVASKPDTKGAEFFETKIRPLLAAECVACHTGANAKGKLDLLSRESILKGGELGPALAPGDPGKSLLMQAVRFEGHLKMPPRGKLSPAQIQALSEWVERGAPWGVEKKQAVASPRKAGGAKAAAAAEPLWSLQPVREPKVPASAPASAKAGAAWARSPLDRFVLARLDAAGLKPNRAASRRTLLRRATLDLIGLPPTPAEMEAFLADTSPDAFAKVVDRLLASPHYGERWGRHWLDVARYADSNGQDENLIFGNAYRYRDYVVKAFNDDKPYDQFIREQLAGDLLPGRTEAETYERLVATGFLMIGPKVLAEPDKPKLIMDVVDEQIDVTTRAFLGVTVACARCHDHKFDPIPTKDYYALAGIFKSTTTIDTGGGIVSRWNERELASPETVAARRAHEEAVKKLQEAIRASKDEAEKTRLNGELKTLEEKAPPQLPMAMAPQDGTGANVRVHIRGNHLTLGDEVPRRFLQAVSGVPQPRIEGSGSGRLELANWIASPAHPLTARVLVNRVWQGHFGQGLVGSTDNFGKLGDRPTHPELLDYLAKRFVEGGWSIKKLHRMIMLSATYAMSSEHTAASYAKDPENRLLWRMHRRRLEAEAIRDSLLSVSGQLDQTLGGMGLIGRSGYATNDQSGNVELYDTNRRSIYLPINRNAVFDMFQVFDFVDPNVPTGRRETTTVAPQALYLMNSPFAIEQARHLARLLLELPAADDSRRVEAAYLRSLGRPPTPAESARVLKYIGSAPAATEAGKEAGEERLAAWQSFCQALLASNEFVYVQ